MSGTHLVAGDYRWGKNPLRSFPSEYSPATMSTWAYLSPATCRWDTFPQRHVAGENPDMSPGKRAIVVVSGGLHIRLTANAFALLERFPSAMLAIGYLAPLVVFSGEYRFGGTPLFDLGGRTYFLFLGTYFPLQCSSAQFHRTPSESSSPPFSDRTIVAIFLVGFPGFFAGGEGKPMGLFFLGPPLFTLAVFMATAKFVHPLWITDDFREANWSWMSFHATILLKAFECQAIFAQKLQGLSVPKVQNIVCFTLSASAYNFEMGWITIPKQLLPHNLTSNLTPWKLGTLPPALVAFMGQVQAIEPWWNILGLGYQKNTSIESVHKVVVIHYNDRSKPWLQTGYKHPLVLL
ncbi:probable galacturonosyltransferase 14 isoform X2 [Tanacetum coccineum]